MVWIRSFSRACNHQIGGDYINVCNLKTELSIKFGYPVDTIKLISCGRELLEDGIISNDDHIYLAVIPRKCNICLCGDSCCMDEPSKRINNDLAIISTD